jgi:hypothetical protein
MKRLSIEIFWMACERYKSNQVQVHESVSPDEEIN